MLRITDKFLLAMFLGPTGVVAEGDSADSFALDSPLFQPFIVVKGVRMMERNPSIIGE